MAIIIENNLHGGLRITGDGKLAGKDLLNVNRSIYATDATIRNMVCQLCDFSTASGFNISAYDAEHIATLDNHAARLNPEIRIAVVASSDLVFGVSRIWDAWVDDSLHSKVFRHYGEAYAWLEQECCDFPAALQNFKLPYVSSCQSPLQASA